MMDSNQVNTSFVENYSKKLAKQLADEYFVGKLFATGTDLITFSKFDQINLFTIQSIFEEWKKEITKIESPFFNYQAHEVKEALEVFMNILSRNIYVKKDVLLPILEKAIKNSILVGANIKFYFELNFSDSDIITIESLKQSEKYYRINRPVISTLIAHLEEENIKELTYGQFVKQIDLLLSTFEKEEIENNDLLQHLTFVLPISAEQIYYNITPAAPVVQAVTPEAINPEPAEDISEMKLIIKETAEADTDKALHEKYALKEQLTLNDMLRNTNATVAESVAKNKLLDIKAALTVNQKFMFINELFKGESWEFDNALSNIGNCPNYDTAINMLLTTYADKYHWDTDNEQVAELFELVSRKFHQS